MEYSLIDEFLIEAQELLDDAEDALMRFEESSERDKEFNSIFRSFHSLKGSAGMMGLDNLQRHMHLLEDHFESHKESMEDLEGKLDYFLQGIDIARKILAGDNSQGLEVEKTGGDKFATSSNVLVVFGENLVDLEKTNYELITVNSVEEFKKEVEHRQEAVVLCSSTEIKKIEKVLEEMNESFPILAIVEEKNVIEFFSTNKKNFAVKNDIYSQIIAIERMIECRNYKQLIDKATMLVVYQFSDLDQFLAKQGREVVRRTLKLEIQDVLDKKKRLFND